MAVDALGEEYDLSHVRELMAADRLVGKTVYVVCGETIEACQIKTVEITAGRISVLGELTGEKLPRLLVLDIGQLGETVFLSLEDAGKKILEGENNGSLE